MTFSERYSELIEYKNGIYEDYICGEIDFKAKGKIIEVMEKFVEPKTIPVDRYSGRRIETDALSIAISNFNEMRDKPHVRFEKRYMEMYIDALSVLATPFLFDVIELQYLELSSEEKKNFQIILNKTFQDLDIPWLLHDGQMIKIDSKQFEQDLKRKALEKMKILTDSAPVFQGAYDEFIRSTEFLAKDNYEEAISVACKSYESVLKIICTTDKGNAADLTRMMINKGCITLPKSINEIGFKDHVLMSLPYIRNNCAAHGVGAVDNKINHSLANLAVNLAAALNTYMIEEYRLDG